EYYGNRLHCRDGKGVAPGSGGGTFDPYNLDVAGGASGYYGFFTIAKLGCGVLDGWDCASVESPPSAPTYVVAYDSEIPVVDSLTLVPGPNEPPGQVKALDASHYVVGRTGVVGLRWSWHDPFGGSGDDAARDAVITEYENDPAIGPVEQQADCWGRICHAPPREGDHSRLVDGVTVWDLLDGSAAHTGDYTLGFKVENDATAWSREYIISVHFDDRAGTASISLPPADPAHDNWYRTPPTATVTLSQPAAPPAPRPIQSENYSIDGPTLGSTSYTGPVRITSDGEHIFYFSAFDDVGNEIGAATANAKVDQTPPSVYASVLPAAPDGANGFYIHNPAVAVTAADATSGVKSVNQSSGPDRAHQGTSEPATDPVTVPEGTTVVCGSAEDVAGNGAGTCTDAIRVDSTAPTATLDVP